jgi:hypothetical protein
MHPRLTPWLPALILVGLWLEPARAGDPLGLLPEAGPGGAYAPAGPAERFQGQKLFDYMNGGAELFLAYGFDVLAVRRYQVGGQAARVAVYRMGSPAEAFGIHAFSRKGPPRDVGCPASLAHGMLSFFRGRHYVRVVAEGQADAAEPALRVLGQAVFARLPGDCAPPADVDRLPPGALDGSLRFLTQPETARTVWFDGEGDVVLTRGARAVMALYPGRDGELQLTRVGYPSPEAAAAAGRALAGRLGLKVEADAAAGKGPDDAFHALGWQAEVLLWVGGAADPAEAGQGLAKLKRS